MHIENRERERVAENILGHKLKSIRVPMVKLIEIFLVSYSLIFNRSASAESAMRAE